VIGLVCLNTCIDTAFCVADIVSAFSSLHLLLMWHIHLLVHCMSSPVLVVQVASAPPGTQACSFDIKTFHCTCSVTPHHKPGLIVQGPSREDFFIDHVHPFSAASASGSAGMIGNGAIDIWIRTGVGPVVKYEDDCNVFHSSVAGGKFQAGNFSYNYNRTEALHCYGTAI